MLNPLDALNDDVNLNAPKKEKCESEMNGNVIPARPHHTEEGIERLAADPGLNAEPSAGNDRAQDRRNVRAFGSE